MSDARIGVYGLGTMGSALALNFADNGIQVAVANRNPDRVPAFLSEAGELTARITAADSAEALVAALQPPRMVVLMIAAGPAVDATIAALRPLLAAGDTLIDAGNADFNDTRRRAADLDGSGLHFVGMGVSGGEEGARFGPSIMVGGSTESWSRLQPLLRPIAAKFRDDPCVDLMGPDGAGHFVKTVHNGIEYADMQMIAEIFGLLRDGAGWPAPRIAGVFDDWSRGRLAGFLVETTARVLSTPDPDSGRPLVDMIRDQAGQKGTGRWTLIEALRLGQSASTIEAAVGARSWSSAKAARQAAAGQLPAGAAAPKVPEPEVLAQALLAGRVLAHLQGFDILRAASDEYGWQLDLPRIAEIWRAGCIIRSALLDDLAPILRAGAGRPALLLPGVAELLAPALGGLRDTVGSGVAGGLPVPALSAGLAWYDTARQATGTANLIQGLRDAFGAHGFERTDRPGQTHGAWVRGDG